MIIFIAAMMWPLRADAEPVAVRLPEGSNRGFLVLRTLEGQAIAHGELVQKPMARLVRTRVTLNFNDGSVYDETVVYSQAKVFRLERYHLVQQGPSFPTTDVSFDRSSGQYKARTQEKRGGEVKVASGSLELPADVYNGMAATLLKNLPADMKTSAQFAAFTPKPFLIKMELSGEGEDRVSVGRQVRKVNRYLAKLDVGGLKGVFAALVGKEPPDVRYWLVTGDVPAFARFEGPMFLNGPVWRLELTTVQWPR